MMKRRTYTRMEEKLLRRGFNKQPECDFYLTREHQNKYDDHEKGAVYTLMKKNAVEKIGPAHFRLTHAGRRSVEKGEIDNG